MNIPTHLKYSEAHEWIRIEGKQATVGVTDFAQNELGDIVFVELPKVGETLEGGEPFGSMESVKTVSELYSPLSGKVVKVNDALAERPGLVNASPYEEGWLIVIEIADEQQADELWSAEKYAEVYGQA